MTNGHFAMMLPLYIALLCCLILTSLAPIINLNKRSLMFASNNNNQYFLANALENKLARTPPMGWLAWERFTCQIDCFKEPNNCINEQLFKSQADKLVANNYTKFGYKYVNIDDCWSEFERDHSDGRLVANRTRFPNGLNSLADYMHERQLKLGLYGDCGTRTCAGYPAQLNSQDYQSTGDGNNFELDAQTLHDWQIDSFKFDGCYIDPLKAEHVCPEFSRKLEQVHRQQRPILLICEWPFYMMYTHTEPQWQIAADSCNVWRYYDDIEDSWTSILNTIDYTIKHQSTIVRYHGPGHWFDPDQLVIGNFGLSEGQARAQMAIWCIWAAPLYMSNDLRHIDEKFEKILKNEHLIAVDQDKLGVFGQMVAQSSDKSKQVFVKPIEPIKPNGCPSFALVYLNRATLGNKQKISFKVRDLLLGAPIRVAAKNQREVLKHEVKIGSEIRANEEILLVKVGECLEQLRRGKSDEQQQQYDSKRSSSVSLLENLLHFTSNAATDSPSSGKDKIINKFKSGLEYEVYDLFDGGKVIGQIGIDSMLELEVEPQSVRAIKLIEL